MPARLVRQCMAVLAAICATVTVGGQALGTLHYVVVRHVVCAEHGELIHESASVHQAARTQSGPDAALRASSAAHAHDHCGLLARANDERPALATASAVSPSPNFAYTSLSDSVELVRSSADILLFAPKQSPPAA